MRAAPFLGAISLSPSDATLATAASLRARIWSLQTRPAPTRSRQQREALLHFATMAIERVEEQGIVKAYWSG